MNIHRRWIALLVIAFISIAAQGKYQESRKHYAYAVTTASGAAETAWVRDTTDQFDVAGWDGLQFRIAIVGDTSTPKGIGVMDSVRVCLLTLSDSATWTRVDSLSGHVPFAWSAKYSDTLVSVKIGTKCKFEVKIFDTLADTIATINYALTEWRYSK